MTGKLHFIASFKRFFYADMVERKKGTALK